MNRNILHTPEGVRDIYKEECAKKQVLKGRLWDVMNRYGYDAIETPTFEFFDVFSRDVGTIPSRELYKFFDREGNTLVLRPDFTPAIARAACKYFMEDTQPVRLCYQGNAFINHSSYRGRMKESTHTGAELIGESSPMGDAEIIAMVVECLQAAGLEEFQISLGHALFFERLVQEAGLDQLTAEDLRDLIANRNSFGVEQLLKHCEIPKEIADLLTAMTALFGGEEMLHQLMERTKDFQAHEAVCRLQEIYELLKAYGVSDYISFDLGMMSSYQYYTGVIFRGYTYGTGDAIVKGGRYDGLLRHFGKDAPSIGFVVVIDELMNALSRQKIALPIDRKQTVITYQSGGEAQAMIQARDLRSKGERVILQKAGGL